MHHACHLLKATSLLLLSAGVFGCAALQSAQTTINEGVNIVKERIGINSEQVSKADQYCDLFEESSYTVLDNVAQVVSATGSKSLEEWWKSRFKRAPMGSRDIEEMVKTVSKDYVWMPLSFEQSLGNKLHERLEKDRKILDRQDRRSRKLYNKADAVLKTAAKDYTKLPYETKLHIVESDQINAEALPAGYIYVTRKAANDLDDGALQLMLGHELAHIAKRHTSKQIQQRLVDTGVAVEMFQRVLENRSMDVIDKLFTGERVIESFHGQFAKYDQSQELQADACSIRGMLSAGADPLKAREEYLRKRGTTEAARDPSKPSSSKLFGLGFTAHPEDEERGRFFQRAYQHHLHQKKSGA